MGWKKCVLSRAEYLSTLRIAADTAAELACLAEASTYESAKEQTTVTSQVSGLPSFHGTIVRPLVSPCGSFVTGTPADAKARATRSFRAWCLEVLPGDLLQTKLCVPSASTKDSQWLWWGTQKFSPSRRSTPTLTASSSSLKPQDAIGMAKSQSQLWSEEAARKEVCWNDEHREAWTTARSASTPS